MCLVIKTLVSLQYHKNTYPLVLLMHQAISSPILWYVFTSFHTLSYLATVNSTWPLDQNKFAFQGMSKMII